MKSLVLMSLLISSVSLAQEQEPRHRVQFHLKKVEMMMQKQQSEAKIRSLEPIDPLSQSETPRYIPNFGVGDEGIIGDTQPHICTSACDLPRALSLQERIRLEAEASRNVSGEISPESEKAEFIKQYKQNAAKKGVKVEVDPKTFQVREIK